MLTKLLEKFDFDENQINISHTNISNRAINEQLESQVENEWQEKLKDAKEKGLKLWNSTLYRLDSYKVSQSLDLMLDTVEYKVSFILGRNEEFRTLEEKYYINHICTIAFIKTADNKWVFGRAGDTYRSQRVDIIGGVCSKDELEINSGHDFFENEYKEMKEEANISKSEVKNMKLKGLLRLASTSIAFIFYVKLNVTSDKVLENYQKENDGDMSELIFVEDQDLLEFLKREFKEIGSALLPIAELLQ